VHREALAKPAQPDMMFGEPARPCRKNDGMSGHVAPISCIFVMEIARAELCALFSAGSRSFMMRFTTLGIVAAVIVALAGCAPDYSPNTYDSAAVQQANKVDQGVVIGFREVKISDDGAVGAVTGGAAGGILGAQTDSPTVPTALTALGGTVVGGIVGNTFQHAVGDTTGWEYIVRETKGDLISVAQREPKPIPIGQKVLVIEGKQARIVADYAAVALESPPPADKPKAAASATTTATSSTVTAVSATPVVIVAPSATPASATVTPPTPVSANTITTVSAPVTEPAQSAAATPSASPPTQNSAATPTSPSLPSAPVPPATPASDASAPPAKGPS
jgi:outer membrane lipoprotein SlyB